MPEVPGSVTTPGVVVESLGFIAPPGLVVLGPEGRGRSGKGSMVELEDEAGVMLVPVVLLPILRQPANKVAVRTKIRAKMLAFFILSSS